MMRRFNVASLVFILGVLVVQIESARGQLKVDKGERVKVFFLNDWRDGVIVESRGNRSSVDYEFAGGTSQRIFNRNQIRKLCEVEALDFARRWQSADGKFKIVAAIKSGDEKNVLLIKEDLSTATVPINRLSTKDITYTKKVLKTAAKMAEAGNAGSASSILANANLPELEKFESEVGTEDTLSDVPNESIKPLGAIPAYMKFKDAGFGFSVAREKDDIISVVPVGGPDELVMVAAGERKIFPDQSGNAVNLYWLSLKSRSVKSRTSLPPFQIPVDYDPRSKRLLTVYRETRLGLGDKTEYLMLWKLMPGADKAEPLVRWKVEFERGETTHFMKVINEDMVVMCSGKSDYFGFDAKNKKVKYSVRGRGFGRSPTAVLSPDRSTLIVCEERWVVLYDAITGKRRAQFSAVGEGENEEMMVGGYITGANISEDGTKLAAINREHILVWDLAKGNKTPKRYRAQKLESPGSTQLNWINDNFILVSARQRRTLYQLSTEMPVWAYYLASSGNTLPQYRSIQSAVVNGRFIYALKPDFKKRTQAIVGAFSLPDSRVLEIAEGLDREQLNLVKRGARVALNLGNVTQPEKIRSWLLAKMEERGWVQDQSSDLKLTASMGKGETETWTFKKKGPLMRYTKGETRTVTPTYSILNLTYGKRSIWYRSTRSGLSEGTYEQGQLERSIANVEKDDPNFFSRVSFPKEILDPRFEGGLGASEIGPNGIEIKFTDPPGIVGSLKMLEMQKNRDAGKR